MKKAKKLMVLILCVCLSLCLCTNALAAESTSPKIKLTKLSAMPNDTVTIDVSIENNPGIMGMAFSIAYDSDAFEFIEPDSEKGENYGGWLSDLTVKDHPDKDHIIFVYVSTRDRTDNGKMLSVKFKIKEKAAPGTHKIALENNNFEKHGEKLHNSFSNSKQEYIVPRVTSGSIKVGETCTNAGHKYGEWNITKPASCTETGLKNHTCTRDEALCIASERYEEVEIPITHDFEDEWTVDEVATPEKDGVMTRHCKKCDATTDQITFSYEEVENPPSTPSTPSDSSDNSSDTESNPSPPINNTPGGKNPLSAVENLEDYKENILPNRPADDATDTSSDTSTDIGASNPNSDKSDTDGENTKDDAADDKNYEDNSFLSTPAGIAVAVVGSILTVGIIALGIMLIIKGKK